MQCVLRRGQMSPFSPPLPLFILIAVSGSRLKRGGRRVIVVIRNFYPAILPLEFSVYVCDFQSLWMNLRPQEEQGIQESE